MGFLEGKKGLIYGVRNQRSIAWGCAQSLAREGAELALTFLGEREEQDVRKLSPELGDAVKLIQGCDLTQPDQVEALHTAIKESLGQLDFVIHAVAFAKKDDLSNPFVQTSADGFALAMNVSAYTLVAAARAAEPLMTEGGSILTLTYLGADRVIPNYNVMGVAKAALESSVRYLASELGPKKIRVNAISAGPVMTLSARGIAGFTGLYKAIADVAPLRKATDIDEVGDTAAFLCSNLSRGITGETLFVDSGYHIVGMITGNE
ncbi:MAG: enoyl-ACP reductase [Armatimonadetes bacterium]|nr:enoyl-ACP reductase [Armatimonadota bacterium]